MKDLFWMIPGTLAGRPTPDRVPWRLESMRSAGIGAVLSVNDGLLRQPDGLDLPALLGRIESEMGGAPPPAQRTMSSRLAAIGIHFPEHRERAVAIGESLGVYRDYPVSKGCTSPFAPIWIAEMVRRQS